MRAQAMAREARMRLEVPRVHDQLSHRLAASKGRKHEMLDKDSDTIEAGADTGSCLYHG